MVGLNDERFGERFFSLANAYDADYRAILQTVAAEEGFPLSEGVFVSYPGPNFETAAEIRMMQIIGGDVVGMSVVPEVICAPLRSESGCGGCHHQPGGRFGGCEVISRADVGCSGTLPAELHQSDLWLLAQTGLNN
jgi:hypothetical protein